MQSARDGRVFRFGLFELNEGAGELRKHGVRVKLHSQPFQVLVMLLEKPSEVVGRKEIRQRLWGDDIFVDFDHGLNTAVNKLREALNDSASQPRYIETVPGTGYRFIAPVSVVSQSIDPSAPEGAEVATLAPASNQPIASASQFAVNDAASRLLTAPHELPVASRRLVRILLLLTQAMYLSFYLGALGNLQEIHGIFLEAEFAAPAVMLTVLIATASLMIPVRLFIGAAVAFDFAGLPGKFRRLFPFLLLMDVVWALSPFLLIHHINTGLALGLCAALVYLPFAQRSLILMYAHRE